MIIGSKAISPFGAVGLLIRRKLREGIHEKYPLMQKDLKQGGMASFLRDMDIEVDIFEMKTNGQGLLPSKKTNQESDVSERLLTFDNSEKAGLDGWCRVKV